MKKKGRKRKCSNISEKMSYVRAWNTKNVRDRIEEIESAIAEREWRIREYREDVRELKEIKLGLKKVIDESDKEKNKPV